MRFYINVVLFLFSFQRIYSFLIISMEVKKVDDCIRKIELDDETKLYERDNNNPCKCGNLNYNKPIFEPIPYEIGQKIKIVIGDNGGWCFFKIDISVNNDTIEANDMKFWDCENCLNFGFNYEEKYLTCHSGIEVGILNNFSFYFKINSTQDLNIQTSKYLYYLNNTKYIFITPSDFNSKINILDLHSVDNLYAKNSEGNIITPFYNYIYYKISFDEFITHKGKLIGSDDSNNDIELDENTYSRIFENKNLRYELSEEEKNNKGAYIRLKIGIYNNQKKLISEICDFDFFICLLDYQDCNIETGKCYCNLNEPEINENYLIGKSYIKLKVNGKGINRIFYSKDNKEINTYPIPPYEVIINNIRKSYVFYEYEFINDINNVILIWNNPFNNLQALFYKCSNITEVDLSHFDSSSLKYIGRLFHECSSLTYVNFTNFITDNVEAMHYMFRECISLKSLDLSNFNTQLVTNMNYMFDNCNNLHYLNLKNFEQNDNLTYKGIFNGIPNNIIVCA